MPDICGCRFFFFSSRRRHTRCSRDWSSDVCSSDLARGDHDHRSRGQHEPLPARHPRTGACLSVVPGHSLLCGGSVWESNPSTVCLERSTGFEVREAHRVPRRFRYCKSALFKRSECTTVAREAPTVTVSPRRSEEHTSELQSRLHLVCRLLLEKKNKRDYDANAFGCM